MMELEHEKNCQPLPPIKQQPGLHLPSDRYCLVQPNLRLKTETKKSTIWSECFFNIFL